jgi:hypothetical protein
VQVLGLRPSIRGGHFECLRFQHSLCSSKSDPPDVQVTDSWFTGNAAGGSSAMIAELGQQTALNLFHVAMCNNRCAHKAIVTLVPISIIGTMTRRWWITRNTEGDASPRRP